MRELRPARGGVAPLKTYFEMVLIGERKTENGATWLHITRSGSTAGLHLRDISLTLGNMIDLVRTETVAYLG